MPQCPQCTKELREFTRRCPTCQADLDLLFDYVSHLQGGLEKAESLTRSGALGQAFWAYLEVLEVDPDNPAAKYQIGQVVTAVRQFDRVALGRRWANGTLPRAGEGFWRKPWFLAGAGGLLAIIAFSLGFVLGGNAFGPEETPSPDRPPPIQKPNNSLQG